MSNRTIFIKARGTKTPIKVTDFQGTTFGELKAHVTDVSFENANVIVHSTKTSLIDDSSLIPSGDVILLVVPKAMKAGADYSEMKRNELMTTVRSIIDSDGEAARQYFGNYPQLKSTAVVALLNGYNDSSAEATVEEESVADLAEYQQVMEDYSALVNVTQKFNSSLAELGAVLLQSPEEVFGGVTLSQLEADFERFSNLR